MLVTPRISMEVQMGVKMQARQREEERLTSVGSRRFDAMLGAIGHGMMRAKKDADIQVGLTHLYFPAHCSGRFGFMLCVEAPLALEKHS